MSDKNCQCVHLRVMRVTNHRTNGEVTSRWLCEECRAKFVKVGVDKPPEELDETEPAQYSKEWFEDKILCATRGSIGDWMDAMVLAVKHGWRSLVPPNDLLWVERVVKLETELEKAKRKGAKWGDRLPETYEKRQARVRAPIELDVEKAKDLYDAQMKQGAAYLVELGQAQKHRDWFQSKAYWRLVFASSAVSGVAAMLGTEPIENRLYDLMTNRAATIADALTECLFGEE